MDCPLEITPRCQDFILAQVKEHNIPPMMPLRVQHAFAEDCIAFDVFHSFKDSATTDELYKLEALTLVMDAETSALLFGSVLDEREGQLVFTHLDNTHINIEEPD